MLRSLDYHELRKRIGQVDELILTAIRHRMDLALSVGARKRAEGKPIVDEKAEGNRLDDIRIKASFLKLNPEFAQSFGYNLIGESCKLQLQQLQKKDMPPLPDMDGEAWFLQRRENLLKLTEAVAEGYDRSYDEGHSASSAYRSFENDVMLDMMEDMDDVSGTALDLGCGTGRQSAHLVPYFSSIIGLDISPHMLAQARKRIEIDGLKNVRFEEADIELGLPMVKDASVALVVANYGTASDIRNLRGLLSEIQRVLIPGGKFFLSFYNSDALLYRWGFLPWESSLAAEMNQKVDCLDVRFGGQTYSIFAKTYTPNEVRAHVSEAIESHQVAVRTYPTISSILPEMLLEAAGEEGEDRREAIAVLDRALSLQERGAYIIATGQKKQ